MAKNNFVNVLADSINNTGSNSDPSILVDVLTDSIHNTGTFPPVNPVSLGPSYLDFVNRAKDMINSGSSLQDFLRLLASYTGPMSGAQGADLTKQLLDQLINYASTLENRQYNEQLRDEQRIYDNPQNQLARLMGAGISRDAAIQMLSGSGSGGGSGVPYSQPAATPQSAIPATQSDLNSAQTDLARMQGSLGVANTILSGVSAVSSLVGVGFSSAQAVQQLSVMKASAYMTDQQKKAYDAASGAFSVLSHAGVENTPELFGNINNTISTIKSLADNGDASAKSFVSSGGIDVLRSTAPFSAPFLNQLYKNERDSADYDLSFFTDIQNRMAQTSLAKANTDYFQEGAKVFQPQIEELRSSANYKDALTALTGKQGSLFDSQISLNNANAEQIGLENLTERSFLQSDIDGNTGLELYTNQRLTSLYADVSKLTYLNDHNAWMKQADEILASTENAKVAYELNTLYTQGAISFTKDMSEDQKSIFYLAKGISESHLGEYMDLVVNVNTSGKVTSQGLSFNHPEYNAQNLLNGLVVPENRKSKPLYQRWIDHIRKSRHDHGVTK